MAPAEVYYNDALMKMGIGLSGDALDGAAVIELGRRMDRHGLDAVWLGEAFYEPFGLLGALSQVTERLRLVAGIASWARSPALMDLAASTIDALAPGRFVLGLGTLSKNRSENHHGVPYDRPVDRMREYLTLVRAMWRAHSGRVLDYEGEFYQVSGFQRWAPPVTSDLPIYLGAVGPKMLELAGELADGVILHPTHTFRSYVELTLPAVRRGLARRNPNLGPCEIVGSFEISIDRDRRRAFERARNGIMFYFRTPYISAVMALHGFSEEQARIRTALEAGDLTAAARLVTDEMVQELAIVGDEDEVKAGIARYDGLVDAAALAIPTAGLSRSEVWEHYDQAVRLFGEAEAEG